MRQRGFPKGSLEMMTQFGRLEKAPGGAMKLIFGNKERKWARGEVRCDYKINISNIDKIKGTIIATPWGKILTIYK